MRVVSKVKKQEAPSPTARELFETAEIDGVGITST
jgi:hypothetical protein